MRRAAFPVLLALLCLSACKTPPREIAGLKTYNFTGGDVRSGSIDYPADAGNPPAGGPYNAFWQTCASYSAPVYDEYAVHSLARGALWATYQPGLSADALAKLKTVLTTPFEAGDGDQKHTVTPRLLLSPRENQAAPIVVTAWNAQVAVQTPDDENLPLFVQRYGEGLGAPERGASCAGGFGGTR